MEEVRESRATPRDGEDEDLGEMEEDEQLGLEALRWRLRDPRRLETGGGQSGSQTGAQGQRDRDVREEMQDRQRTDK